MPNADSTTNAITTSSEPSTFASVNSAVSAAVAGNLLTLTFDAPLDTSSVPSASDFSLQTQQIVPNQPTPSIGNIVVSNDSTTGNGVVVLQLSQPIAYSPQFTGTNPQPNGQAAVTVSYTGTTLEYADDNTPVDTFSDLSVTNNSSASLSAVFNPTAGNGNDYTIKSSQTAFLGTVDADYGQDSPPALALVNQQVLAVWSREVQPLTPIAGFVNKDKAYLNFVQGLGPSTPQDSQFTVYVNGDPSTIVVNNVAIEAGGYVQLNLSDSVTSNDEVSIAYQPYLADSNLYLTDAVQSKLWIPAFSENLTNTTGQSTTAAPTPLGGAVIIENTGTSNSNNLITLIFNGLLGNNNPNGTQFTVTSNGQTYGGDISGVIASGNTVTFNLSAPSSTTPLISQGDIVSVTYTPSGGDTDLTGNNNMGVSAFTTQLTTLPETPTTTLMAGFYPGSTTALSSFQNIPGTEGFNFDPAVASDTSGNALAVWVYADSSDLVNLTVPGAIYTDNQSQVIINALSQSDIYFSYWNGSEWTIAAPLATNQPGTDSNVTVAYYPSSDQYIAAWLNNNDTFQIFDPEVESSAAPALINNNGTLYLAYVEQGGSQIFLTTSSNAGQTWTSPVQLPNSITTSQSPALAFYQGALYLAYVGTNNWGSPVLNITSSADNGQTWSSPYSPDDQSISSAGVSLVVYQGQLMAFFVQADALNSIAYVYSSNPQSSNSWSTAYNIMPNQSAGSAVSATVMDETLYLAYRGVDSPVNYYITNTNSSTLSSLNWSTSELSGATSPNTAPGITNDGSQLYFTYGDSNGNLNYLTSSDGSSWSGLNEINNQTSNDTPSPAILNGALYLGYTGTAEENIVVTGAIMGETTIYWASYDPTGNTWSTVNTVLSEANPDPLTDLVLSSVNSLVKNQSGSVISQPQPALFWTQTQPISYSQLTQQNNPDLYFRFGELTGTTARNSGVLGSMANGTYNGSFTLKETGALFDSSDKSGDPNPAALFSNGGSVTLGGALNTSSSAFSIEFWFKIPTAVSAATNLVSLDGVFDVVLNDDGTLTFSLNNSSSITTSASANPIATDTWQYVVGTYSNQTQDLNLYLNGQQLTPVNNVAFTPPATASLTIAGGTSEVYLDEVALYSSVLSYSAPTASPQTVNSLDLINSIVGTNQIGEKYAAQYVAPLLPGPEAQVSFLDSSTTTSSWSAQSLINPLPLLQPTSLSDANSFMVDVVSNTIPNQTGNISPNGQEDTIFSTTINGFQGKIIESITLTLSNNVTYSVGGSNSDNQLGVVIGDYLVNNPAPSATPYTVMGAYSLINSTAPNATFSYAIMGASLTLNLLVDTGSAPSASVTAKSFTINFKDGSSASSSATDSEKIDLPTYVPPNSVPAVLGNESILGTATVTENEDSSLTLIDSGFVINTTNPVVGYTVASADFNNDGKSDVAVGNRGYTDSSGDILNNGTVQILMGGQAVLGGNSSVQLSSPTSADAPAGASGNTGGFSIIGIPDGGQANGDLPLSMATGSVQGPVTLTSGNTVTYTDLVIGSPNNNTVYVIYGSYLASAPPETVIDVGSLSSDQGYSISPTFLTLNFGSTLNSSVIPTVEQFSVTSNSQALTVESLSLSGSSVILVVEGTSLDPSNTFSVAYQQSRAPDNNLQTSSGTLISNFTVESNNSSTNPPTINNPTLAVGSGWEFGFAVAVGNFDGTDQMDIAIGAPNAINGQGMVYVAYNGSSSVQSVYTGSSYTDSTTVGSIGEQAGYALGTSSYIKKTSTSPAGPATFSGSTSTDDLIIGAPNFVLEVTNNWTGLSGLPTNNPDLYSDSTPVNVGAVYVFTSSSSPSGLNSSPSFTYYGTDATTPSANGAAQPLFAGSALASNGDWDGDGQLDLAIAAPADNENNGAVYILSGAINDGTSSNPQYLNAISNLTLNGGLPLGQVGAVVTSAGDVNGDRYDDLLVTAPQGANAVGQGYVVFGETALFKGKVGDSFRNLSPVATDSKTTFLLNGNFPYQLTGQAAAAIGDINKDGVDDLMITAPNANQLYAVYGHPWLADDGSIKLANISGDNGFVTDGDLYTLDLGTQIINLDDESSNAPALINNDGTFYLAFVGEFASEYERGGLIYLTTSSDAGQTWTNAISLPSNIITNESPALAFYQGVLYLAYVGTNNELNLTYSTNNGQTWNDPYVINQSSSGGVSLAVYQGKLMAFFVADNPSADILYVYSGTLQTSNSWSAVYSVLDQFSENPVSVAAMGNTLYLAYINENGSYYVANTSGSDLTNLEWNGSIVDGTNNPGAAPGITTDGSQLYLSYVDSSGALYYSTSDDGASWSGLTEINNQFSNTVEEAAPAVLDGILYLTYINTDSDEGNIFVTALGSNRTLVGTGNNVVMLGDVNGDGFADILAGGSPYGAILTFGASTQDLLDSATGSDESIVTVAGGSIQTVLAAGDFNGDGLADFGVVDLNNNFYLVFGDTQLGPQKILSLSTGTNTSLGNISSAAAAGDYDGDGYDDLLLTFTAPNDQPPTTYIYKGNSRGALNSSEVFTDNNNTVFNAIGDVNGDGFGDIGGGAPTSNQVSPFYSIPNGGGTVYFGNSAANSDAGNALNPPAAGVSAPLPLQTDSSSWHNNTYDSQQTKFNSAPSFATLNNYLYMAYTGVTNSSSNGSLFLQRSADGFNWSVPTNQTELGQASTGYSLAVLDNTLYAAYVNTSAELIIAYTTPSDNDFPVFSNSQTHATGTSVSYVSPAMAVFDDTLYVFFATGSPSESDIGYYTYDSTNGWSQNPTSVPIPSGYNALLPLGSAIGVAVDETNIYLSYATGTGATTSLTFATFDVQKSNWTFDTIANSPTRGSGLLYVGDTLYNFYLPSSSSGDMNVITSTNKGETWSDPSTVQAVSDQYWLTCPNPAYFQESIILGYGVQLRKNYNVDVSYAISNPIYQLNQTQQFGQQLESIGDFNGDGIADFAVLAPGFFSNTSILTNEVLENNQGAVLIYYGSTNGFDSGSSPNPDVVLATPAPTASTNVANNQALLLTQFAPTGDINGDGYDDLIISSPNTALDSNNTTDGLALVVFGGGESLWGNTYPATNPFNLGNLTPNTSQLTLYFSTPLNTGSLPAASAFTVQSDFNSITVNSITSANPNELTLNLAGDANTSDFLTVSYTQPSSGTALTYLSGTNVANFTASNDAVIATLGAPIIEITTYPQYGFQITGLPEAQSGISLNGGGDVNGDGFSDFLIGAPGNDDNLAYTLFGSDFNQTVNQTGTIGDDVMVGSPTGESFVAGQGDDLIATGGGVDVVYAGPGNDQVIVNDVYFQRLDGGPGLDGLFFHGYNGQAWDLTTLSPGLRLRNFEYLVTEDYGANTLTLNSLTVTQISPTNTLSLILDGTDSVVLSSDFSHQGTVYQYNRNFQEYTSSSSAAKVLINQPNVSVSSTAPSTNTPAPILPNSNSASAASLALTTVNSAESENFVTTEGSTTVNNASQSGNTVPTQIYVSNPTVSERTGRAEFTITRTGDLNQYVWADYFTQDGDAKAGDRYTPVAGQLVFAPGETTKTVTVPIPRNGKYVGDRQFGLVVKLEGETTDPALVPDAWQATIATPNEQIRRWTLIPGEEGNNSVTFDVTSARSADRIVTLDLDLDGTVIPQIWNPATLNYQNLPFSNTNGIAQFQDIDGDFINNLYRLKFQDGGPFDGDGLVNGLVALNFELAQLKSIPVPGAGGIVIGTEGNNYLNAQATTGTNRLEGLGGMDTLIGSPQRDVLLGGDGNDQLFGGAGVDQLFGGAGDDLLDGGKALDFLYGGAGADNFVLRAGDGGDRVMDFNATEGDLFLLDNLIFGVLSFTGNKISLGAELLATVVDHTGNPVTDLGTNPQWFVSI